MLHPTPRKNHAIRSASPVNSLVAIAIHPAPSSRLPLPGVEKRGTTVEKSVESPIKITTLPPVNKPKNETDMNKRTYRTLLLAFALPLLLARCSDDKFDDGSDLTDNQRVNAYTLDLLTSGQSLYLWADQLSAPYPSDGLAPDAYIRQLRHHDDRWSNAQQDPLASRAEVYENDDTEHGFGYHLLAYQIQSGATSVYLAWIAYVYPGSPADLAGLRRGDIIVGRDDSPLSATDLNDLNNADRLSLTVSDASLENPRDVTLSATNYTVDPVLATAVLPLPDGSRVGYLHYTRFVYTGTDALDRLNDATRSLRQQGITHLVLDLRYNPGGYELALRRLASLVAPADALASSSVFIRKQYNDYWQPLLEEHEPDALVTRLDPGVLDDLRGLYVITGSSTASSSEVLINGLSPYYGERLVTIGEQTVGKDVGGVTRVPDDEDINQWQITYITFRDVNSEGASVEGGIEPDTLQMENLDAEGYFLPDAHSLGDADEPLLATALALVQGLEPSASAASRAVAVRPSGLRPVSVLPLRHPIPLLSLDSPTFP